ncbi:hypothetical protein [Streptomyces nodosus]|uniref:hypothetical protein n=1 Tax=Streptomyces nodosus TaxID=40318 RepID=UPI0006941FD5|nr:hypothetical protein [Streptomyces nodosus]MBB4792048.1 hypothetical protein [Streptomyces nodosus]
MPAPQNGTPVAATQCAVTQPGRPASRYQTVFLCTGVPVSQHRMLTCALYRNEPRIAESVVGCSRMLTPVLAVTVPLAADRRCS